MKGIMAPLFIFTFIFVVAEGRNLFKNQQWKELVLTSVMLLIAWLYGADINYNLYILPTINDLLQGLAPFFNKMAAFFRLDVWE
ncbi:MAG: hypothetical protein LBR98_07720 [Syntrophomonadaceae bacterium]|jgi:hypothetical protein|nr:hypothetical protein [Syntrophomonadaceae bacterium]